MTNMKSIFSFKNKKTFSQALGFYLFHLLFAFILSFVIESFLFVLIFGSYFDNIKVIIFTKIFYTAYLIFISIFIVKNRVSQNKFGYLSLMLLGALATYILNPWLGYLFLAYITTLGAGKSESSTTVV